jgi:DNA-binding Lrp family transcriptional regulator
MKAFILIKIHAGEVRQVVGELKKAEGVIEAHMTFGPYDAIAIIEVKDINHLGRIVSNVIGPIPGVIDTLTCLATDV